MKPIYIDYLNALDVEELALTDDEIIGAVEAGLAAQGHGQVVIEPRMHLMPDAQFNGHFNVLRGYVAPMNLAGVKVVGDFVDNYRQGLPSEFGVLNLFDPRTGVPRAILDATAITEMRTGAVTAVGAKHLAPPNPKVLGHIGARGTAYWNVRLLDHLFGFDEIRVHSRRPESRDAFAAKLAKDLGKPVRAVDSWEDCVVGADIVVEASRLDAPAPLLKTDWIKPGALVVPYGTMSAVELSLTTSWARWWWMIGASVARDLSVRCDPMSKQGSVRGDAACRTRADRGGDQGRARRPCGNDSVLAPRPVAQRHRARACHAGKGRSPRDRPASAVRLKRLIGALVRTARRTPRPASPPLSGERPARRSARTPAYGCLTAER